MKESAFLPGCNWQKTREICCVGPNILCYGSKQDIVVVRKNEDGFVGQIIPLAHDKFVNGLCGPVSGVDDSLLRTLVSCGVDGLVRLWNLDSLVVIKAHKAHTTRDTQMDFSVNGVSWSPADPNLIVSAASNGCIVAWHLAEHVTNKFSLRLKKINSVTCSPSDPSIVGVGTVSGNLAIAKLAKSNPQVIHNLRACETGIMDLAWQPADGDSIIAVTSGSGELSLWRSKSGRSVMKTRLTVGNDRMIDKEKSDLYPLAWYNENTLLTRKGKALVAFDVHELVESKSERWDFSKQWRTIHQAHRWDFHGLAPEGNMVWTSGGDRTLAAYDMVKGSLSYTLGTMFGGAICAAPSPHDPNRIAIGSADGCVRIWDVTRDTGSAFVFSKNIRDRVMAVTWHPQKENIVLFGTSAGRIGLLNPSAGSPSLLYATSNKDVYWLCWGPAFSDTTNETSQLHLYAVSSLKIFVYKDIFSDKAPEDLTSLLQPQLKATDLAWKPDYSIMAVGCSDGKIALFIPGCFTACHVLSSHKTLIQYLAWHPQMTISDSENSPYQDLLTCGSRDDSGEIVVFKVNKSGNDVTSTVFASFKAHQDYVQSVSWSPHYGGHLVSTSGDCIVKVWNVTTQTQLVSFAPTPGFTAMFAIWCPIDSDFIISGSMNSSIHMWKISSKIGCPSVDITGAIARVGKKKKSGRSIHVCQYAVENGEGGSENVGHLKHKTKTEKVSHEGINGEHLAKAINSTVAQPKILTNSWSTDPNDFSSCYELLKCDETDRVNKFSLSVFAPNDSLEDNLSKISLKLSTPSSAESLGCLMLWKGELKDLLRKRIDEGGLSDWLVSMAPSVSPRLWLEACQAYARQLRVERRFCEAANYYFVSQQVEEAVKCLVEGSLFVEALLMARYHLPEEDIYKKIVVEYAQYLEKQGQLRRASECYIYLKDFNEVGRVLSQVKDAVALNTAAIAFKIVNNLDQVQRLSLQALQGCVVQGNPQFIETICSDHPELKVLQLLHNIYNWTQDSGDCEVLLDDLRESVNLENLPEAFNSLQINLETKTSKEQKENLLIWRCVQEIALSLYAVEPQQRQKHVLRALDAYHSRGFNCLYSFCRRLHREDEEKSNSPSSEGGYNKSIRAFLCIALVEHLDCNPNLACTLLPRIQNLAEDLLDKNSIRYHRAKVELSVVERSFSEKVMLTTKDKKRDSSIEDQSALINSISLINLVDSDAKEMKEDKEISSSSSKIQMLVEERNKLLSEIKEIELNREIVPNPVPYLLKLRNLSETLNLKNEKEWNTLCNLIDSSFLSVSQT